MEAAPAASDPMPPIDILHRDDDLVVVNKPAGMPVHRSQMVNDADEYLVDVLREQLGGNVFLAHRLDRATSGVLLVARSSAIAAALGEQFMQRTVHKRYLAVVRGWPEPDTGVIDYPLPGARETGPRHDARTGYRRLATVEVPIALGRYPQQRYALLEAAPETGRFRQIRKHLAHLHHPVIGDCQHGRSDHNRLFKQYYGCHRMLLHAWHLDFIHPVSGTPMALHAPLDAAFAAIVARFDWQAALPPA